VRADPHTDPIPPGWLPAASVVPAHPTADLMGAPIPFDRDRYDRFQELLRRYGDDDAVTAKSDAIRACCGGGVTPWTRERTATWTGPGRRTGNVIGGRLWSYTENRGR